MNTRDSVLLKYAKLLPRSICPYLGSSSAAGYDLASAYDYIVPARGKLLVKTDIQIELPRGCYGGIAPRSGLASKYSIHVGAGVIDPDYRGNLNVLLYNFEETDYEIKYGDKIAQLICEKIYLPVLQEEDTLSETQRNISGLGSTGQ